MKLMRCPLNGWRNISEFTYGGEVESMPNPVTDASDVWAEYLFFHQNPAGLVHEWWCHTATSYWFIAERNTVTDEIIKTYPASELFQKRVDFSQEEST